MISSIQHPFSFHILPCLDVHEWATIKQVCKLWRPWVNNHLEKQAVHYTLVFDTRFINCTHDSTVPYQRIRLGRYGECSGRGFEYKTEEVHEFRFDPELCFTQATCKIYPRPSSRFPRNLPVRIFFSADQDNKIRILWDRQSIIFNCVLGQNPQASLQKLLRESALKNIRMLHTDDPPQAECDIGWQRAKSRSVPEGEWARLDEVDYRNVDFRHTTCKAEEVDATDNRCDFASPPCRFCDGSERLDIFRRFEPLARERRS